MSADNKQIGTHRFARTFQGKADILKGDQVVVEAQEEARAKDGREYVDTGLAKAILG